MAAALMSLVVLAGCTRSDASPAPTSAPVATTAAPTSAPTSVPTATTVLRPAPATLPRDVAVPHEVVDGFDDHTVSRIASVGEFGALAAEGVGGMEVVKFLIPSMSTSDAVRWMDGAFYALHDEWYWFRLLNGRSVPGFETTPVVGPKFATVDQIEEWASALPAGELPLDLEFIESRTYGKRLYSGEFYRVGLPGEGRNYGAGSVVYLPGAADGRDHWMFELEFSDEPTPDDVDRYFSLLSATLPAEIADRLEWVIRSPAQDAVARSMIDAGLARHDRIVWYRDLVPPGEAAVYNPGIAAGRLLVVDGVNTHLDDATEHDIVLIEHVPDALPPAAALLTDDPQTPLAHVNLLARNRGIPNASLSGMLADPGIRQAARVRGYAVVRASGDGTLELSLITQAQYQDWRTADTPEPIAVPSVDRTTLPLVVDLTEAATTIADDADIARWRPVIGGKAAGFLTMLAAPGVTLPPDPLAITVAPYLEHLETVDRELTAMLADDGFAGSAITRFAFLEGPADLLESYPDEQALVDDLLAAHPEGTPLGDVLAAGGFKRFFRDQPMDPATLAAIMEALREQYGDYLPTQGIRFRSSSSVEDIEGFNGAGLYESHTGFLDPAAAGEDPDQSVEETIKDTWSSYWGYEAFEERRLERVDHRSGAMALLVHARFDDPLELNNGVATLTLLPERDVDAAVAVINVQVGAESVTNPDSAGGDLPEVVEVRRDDGGRTAIDRRARSTLLPGGDVLDDAALEELFGQLESTARLWRDRVNASLSPDRRVQTVTLDFEFDTVAAGWPASVAGRLPSRLVLTQARSLDPGLRDVPSDVVDLDVPRDVLARASLVRRVCTAGSATVEIFTDPLVPPDMGFAEEPLVVPAAGDACAAATLYATPARLLLDLLAGGTRLR